MFIEKRTLLPSKTQQCTATCPARQHKKEKRQAQESKKYGFWHKKECWFYFGIVQEVSSAPAAELGAYHGGGNGYIQALAGHSPRWP